LAGSIRQDRRGRKSGRALILRKLRSFHNRLLPSTLEFKLIDTDEEVSQGLGRARLSNATAMQQLKESGFITADEGRQQLIADGMFTIPLTEKAPKTEEKPSLMDINRPDVVDQVERPVAPSQGGHGGIQKSLGASYLRSFIKEQHGRILGSMTELRMRRLVRKALRALLPSLVTAARALQDEELVEWNTWYDGVLFWGLEDIEDYVSKAVNMAPGFMRSPDEDVAWWKIQPSEEEYQKLVDTYRIWFFLGASRALQQINDYLYEEEITNLENPPESAKVRITEDIVLAILLMRAQEAIAVINDGTETFIWRALIAGIRRTLTAVGVSEWLREGIDAESIMANNSLVSKIIETVRSILKEDFIARLEDIDLYEEYKMQNYGVLAQLKNLGLTQKQWEHFGDDTPCVRCQKNIAAGVVPLDFKYETAFGVSETGPGHPNCHCRVRFVKSDLQTQMLAAQFPINLWKGEM